MSNRHKKIGFKQIVRLEWMDRTLSLVLAGLSEKEIRLNLEEYLSTQRQSGGEGPIRNKATFGMSIILLSCWFREEPELDDFRQALIAKARATHQKDWLPLHWALLGASYPFFTVVCEQIGRLFALQEEITSGQVYSRMRQAFGDKEMIYRNARYVVSSLVSWGLLEVLPSGKNGHYGKPKPIAVDDFQTSSLLLEGLLLSMDEERSEWNALVRHRALYGFDFEFSSIQELIRQSESRVEFNQVGLTTTMLSVVKRIIP